MNIATKEVFTSTRRCELIFDAGPTRNDLALQDGFDRVGVLVDGYVVKNRRSVAILEVWIVVCTSASRVSLSVSNVMFWALTSSFPPEPPPESATGALPEASVCEPVESRRPNSSAIANRGMTT